MSNSLSPHDKNVLEELTKLLGVVKNEPKRDYDEEAAYKLINEARGLLMEAINDDRIKRSELARRLNVNPSLVTRFFKSGNDMKVSSLAFMARAIGREWKLQLIKPQTGTGCNYDVRPSAWNINQPETDKNLNESVSPRTWESVT